MTDDQYAKRADETDEEYFARVASSFAEQFKDEFADMGNNTRAEAYRTVYEMFTGLLLGGFSHLDAALTLGAYLYIAASADRGADGSGS